MTRPSLLFLSHRLPYPPHNGAALRTYNVLRLLARDFDITALCFDRFDAATARLDQADRVRALEAFGRVEVYPIPQERSRLRLLGDHLRSVVTGRPYTWYVHESAPYLQRVSALLREHRWDIVHLDSLDLLRVVPLLGGETIVCTHHNAEAALLRRRAAAEPVLRRWYMRWQANRLERAEAQCLGRFALNIVVSDDDATLMRGVAPLARVAVVPNGVDTDFFRPTDAPVRDCVFVGGTSWFPNRDALLWCVDEILPRLRARVPDATVTWVGRVTEAERARLADVPGLTLTGYVEDIRPFVARAACFIAPLRVGGGTRLKLLDALAMGKAIVSTRIGAEGLGARDGEEMLLADDADAFADAVHRVLGDAALRERLAHGARALAERRFSWDGIGERLREQLLPLVRPTR